MAPIKIFPDEVHHISDSHHVPGWCDGRVVDRLREISAGKKIVVHLGVWKGKSVLASADTIDPVSGIVFGVDHFWGSKDERDKDHAEAVNPLSILIQAHYYASQLGRRRSVIFLTMDTGQAAAYFPFESVEVLFVDGGHDYQSVINDLWAWSTKMKFGSVMCGDDYKWPGVRQAVSEFVAYWKKRYPEFKRVLMFDDDYWEINIPGPLHVTFSG